MKRIIITEDQLMRIIYESHTDAVLLRKMTHKSAFHSGKYNGVTVQEILNIGKKSYIRWVYFNMSMITFMDDILDEIHIPEEYRITKPGKNPEMGEELEQILINSYSPIYKRIIKHKNKRHDDINLLKTYGDQFSINKLTKKNQGHSVNIYPKKKL